MLSEPQKPLPYSMLFNRVFAEHKTLALGHIIPVFIDFKGFLYSVCVYFKFSDQYMITKKEQYKINQHCVI